MVNTAYPKLRNEWIILEEALDRLRDKWFLISYGVVAGLYDKSRFSSSSIDEAPLFILSLTNRAEGLYYNLHFQDGVQLLRYGTDYFNLSLDQVLEEIQKVM